MYSLLALSLLPPASAKTPDEHVRVAVASHLQLDEADVEVRGIGALVGVPTDGDCGVQLPRVGAVEGNIPVTIFCGDGRWQTHAFVEVWRTVPVARAAARAGETVDYRMERVSSERLRGEEPVDDTGTWRARVDLDLGAPLTTTRVRPAPDAERGATVQLVAGTAGLVVTADGQLLQEGWRDKPVSVLNLSTRTVVQGVYRGDGLVTLGEP